MTYGDAFEYQILREELISLKNCITNYVGFVIGGSGLGLLGISLSVGTSVNQNLLLISTFTLSLIISIVMLVIMYKFTSHNRMAGYCKLLSHEQVIPSENSKHDPEYVLQSYTNSFSWEICLDRLRESDLNPSNLINLLKELQYSGCEHERMKERIEYFTGPTPKSDEKKFQKGVLLFVKTLSGNLKTSSWSFPSPVLVIIFILSSFYMLMGFYLTFQMFKNGLNNISDIKFYSITVFIVFVVGIQTFLWWTYIKKLYTLLSGSATIEGFCWRFMPLRIYFLNQHGITPNYISKQDVPVLE